MKSWGDITREDYMLMIDRHWPFWAALDEFVMVNGIKSIVEAGCGLGQMCHRVDSYIGIDLNQTVLTDNELFHGRGTWLCGDWLEMDGLAGELFLSSALIEHCESFQVFLEKMLSLPFRYAVVTFHKSLRRDEVIRQHPTGMFHENYYCRPEVQDWLYSKLGTSGWRIFDLRFSRRKRQARRESVLVIDRTGSAKLDMWSKRAL